jgi:1-acyl-sn-glycerol-3-phosphate acyltransferase
LLGTVSVSGVENIRRLGPGGYILAANHASLADPILVLGALHRLGIHPVILATEGLWRVPVLAGLLTREGHIPVRRGSTTASAALAKASAVLKEGRSILIYPEGGLPRYMTSCDRPPGRLKSGAVRLASEAGVPLVPLGHAGTRRVSSGSTRRKQIAGLATAGLRRPRLHLCIGSPMLISDASVASVELLHSAMLETWAQAVRSVARGTRRAG